MTPLTQPIATKPDRFPSANNLPGGPEPFARADMLDTKVGSQKKDDPAEVAKDGFDAMMRGYGEIDSGLKNKMQVGMASVTPSSVLVAQHRRMAEPGTANK